MVNKTKEINKHGFVQTLAVIVAVILGIIAIVWFSIITTSLAIYLAAIGFVMFLVYLAYSLIVPVVGKVIAIIVILAIAFMIL